MEPSPKFELEAELRKWRRAMAETGLASEVLVELEEHLREDFERQVRAGVGDAEAWEAGLERMGPAEMVRDEFARVGGTKGVIATLRRHKWKLALGCAAGLMAAVVLQVVRPGMYQSDAKLFFRFALAEAAPFSQAQLDGLTIAMNDEIEILSSRDLAHSVAESMGPARILRKTGGGEDLERAADQIRAGLMVRPTPRSTILYISFRHPDSTIIQPVLRGVIEQFLRVHVELHRPLFPEGKDQSVSVSSITNILQVQSPTPPWFNFAALVRMQALAIAAGIVGGLGWVWAVARMRDERFSRNRVA